jgi:hypothetical protein
MQDSIIYNRGRVRLDYSYQFGKLRKYIKNDISLLNPILYNKKDNAPKSSVTHTTTRQGKSKRPRASVSEESSPEISLLKKKDSKLSPESVLNSSVISENRNNSEILNMSDSEEDGR